MAKREWDADKVRRVMEGTAVVRVVDVEPAPAPAPAARAGQAASAPAKQEKACVALLAESMASLNIGKK